ncbi:MAG: hypothetical protein A2W61_07485 [Deltaproteobacteria bacterium RIFCSPLOWO2_01_44_7]|nr:MAG: hypothetical protein A2712_08605 [Deltaproteobacteria bacterium RIFCSPHIGHO2_01_FULL_43_49]OGQ14602.1 MAG: hypothetical protein A3D22_08395 [Deltaproteobacteria bacterium RIFCSPHIGHO2_02_FULL_44_53]OGQ27988.1 MAG: hypothetical protein A3D98_07105 [Deltaproteobacteria bacterium RIFCSPHIGHO2_12_FULL_44_21]OGQ31200.1 MAG: hypothetical protein A2979_07155 [Deltaproteobacteria bacterium RIFCSPLOWO2_01_FULL_45_74]OGQ37972.1 MAG: hypothetical protein A2W61_07485 [Deltaproteobacteria bacterium 
MKRKPDKIPESVLACVWFANPEELDWEDQKEIVITQVLNRGTWAAVRWIHQFYGEEEMKKVVKNPKRGLWFPQTLQFWSLFFKISLDPKVFERALFHLSPDTRLSDSM